MTTAIELSPAELELIEAKRAEKAAAEERKAAEQKAREEKARLAQEREDAAVQAKVDALLAADEDGILFIKNGRDGTPIKSAVYFMLNDREEDIRIEEHRVYGGWRGTSKGIKYRLTGTYNDYNQRYYTNPKTVIKRVKEYQEVVVAKRKRAKAKANLSTRALELATEMYPNCEVSFEQGYDGRHGRYNQKGSYRPDRIKVVGKGGHYEFTFHDYDSEDRGLELSVYTRKINKEIDEQVRKLILG